MFVPPRKKPGPRGCRKSSPIAPGSGKRGEGPGITPFPTRPELELSLARAQGSGSLRDPPRLAMWIALRQLPATVIAGLFCLSSQAARAAEFHPIASVTSSTSNDLWPVSNLIQGPGEGFAAGEPHDQLGSGASHRWVTAAPGGFPSDYIEETGKPVLLFDLGEDRALSEISCWGLHHDERQRSERLPLAVRHRGRGNGRPRIVDRVPAHLPAGDRRPGATALRVRRTRGGALRRIHLRGQLLRQRRERSPGRRGPRRVRRDRVCRRGPQPQSGALAGGGLHRFRKRTHLFRTVHARADGHQSRWSGRPRNHGRRHRAGRSRIRCLLLAEHRFPDERGRGRERRTGARLRSRGERGMLSCHGGPAFQ